MRPVRPREQMHQILEWLSYAMSLSYAVDTMTDNQTPPEAFSPLRLRARHQVQHHPQTGDADSREPPRATRQIHQEI